MLKSPPILAFEDSESLPSPCSSCVVRNSSVCGALDAEQIRDLNAIARRKKLERGQFHVFENDKSRDFANVINGVGKLVRGAEDGRTQIVGLLFASDFIGNAATVGEDSTEPYSIEAATPLELCIFPRKQFEPLLERHPQIEHRLLKRTLNELQVARDWMVLLGRKTAAERVASFLLHVAQRMQAQSCVPSASFELPLSRTDIADHIGLTIETVSRQITKLRKAGVLEMDGNRRVVRVDSERLAAAAGF